MIGFSTLIASCRCPPSIWATTPLLSATVWYTEMGMSRVCRQVRDKRARGGQCGGGRAYLGNPLIAEITWTWHVDSGQIDFPSPNIEETVLIAYIICSCTAYAVHASHLSPQQISHCPTEILACSLLPSTTTSFPPSLPFGVKSWQVDALARIVTTDVEISASSSTWPSLSSVVDALISIFPSALGHRYMKPRLEASLIAVGVASSLTTTESVWKGVRFRQVPSEKNQKCESVFALIHTI